MTTMNDELAELAELLLEEENERKYNKLDQWFQPGPLSIEHYPKHQSFIEATRSYMECCFMGANRVGKSELGCYMVAVWLTGLYPEWWTGRRFDGPVEIWVAGKTHEKTREILQTKLMGNTPEHGDEALGTGMIPKDRIKEAQYRKNTNKIMDWAIINHVDGYTCSVAFKAYEQRRKGFEGTSKHVILLDEEPPRDIYQECLMRIVDTSGVILATFTPLDGYTSLVTDFMAHEKRNTEGASCFSITCGWDHVPHLDPDTKKKIIASTPPHLRKSRMQGIPSAGVGMVYPIEEDQFVISPIAIPDFWPRVAGMDHGYHNTGAVWAAWDKDNDVVYVYSDYKRGEVAIEVHASAFAARGKWIPMVGDAAQRESDSKQIIDKYRSLGVPMRLPNKGKIDGRNSVEFGISEVYSRLQSGRLKVFSNCQKLLDEFRKYRYDENQKIIKENDHILDALRYLLVSGLRIARSEKIQNVIHFENVRFG